MYKIMIVALAVALSGCATNRDRAVAGQTADVVTTAIALAAPNVYEMNPLGVLALPVKYAALKHADTLPAADQDYMHRWISALGWGAAANNVCVTLTALSGGTTAAPCLLIGLGAGVHDFKQTELKSKRAARAEFDVLCEQEKQRVPGLTCIWTEPE